MFLHRQAAGALRDGEEPLRHALPRLPHDLWEHDIGGGDRAGEEVQADHSQLGLPETAEGAGHAAPGQEESSSRVEPLLAFRPPKVFKSKADQSEYRVNHNLFLC